MKVSKLTKTSFLLLVILSVGFVFINPAIGDSWTIDRLTDDVREEHAPVWSPDGTKIAYISRPETGGATGELHVLDLATGTVDIIYDYVFYRVLHWVGDYIAFVKYENPSHDTPGDYEVWKIKEDGTGLQQITFTYTNGIDRHIWGDDGAGTAADFALSPDGSKLAFVAHHGNGWFDPYVCNADGSDGYVLLQNLSHCAYIKWNANGSKVYYAAGSDYYPPQTMYRSNPDGSGDETITANLPMKTDFIFSRDGNTLALITGIFHKPCKSCSYDQLDRNLTIMNPDGSGRTDLLNDSFDDAFGQIWTLTPFTYYASRPSFHVWGPDNETIVFTSDRSGNFDIWTIKKDGTNLTQITVDTARDYDAGFSPDGSKILFISERDGQRDLYLMAPEPVIETLIDIDPDTLNRKSHGKWITVYITLPDGFDVGTIDTSSIAITSLAGVTCDPEYTQGADLSFTPQVGDRDEDGILDLTVKFDRQVLLANLCLDDVSITIEGELTTGELFSGSDSIRIIDRGK